MGICCRLGRLVSVAKVSDSLWSTGEMLQITNFLTLIQLR